MTTLTESFKKRTLPSPNRQLHAARVERRELVVIARVVALGDEWTAVIQPAQLVVRTDTCYSDCPETPKFSSGSAHRQ